MGTNEAWGWISHPLPYDATVDQAGAGWMLERPLQLKKGDVLETFIDEHPRIIVRSPDGTTREYPLHLPTRP